MIRHLQINTFHHLQVNRTDSTYHQTYSTYQSSPSAKNLLGPPAHYSLKNITLTLEPKQLFWLTNSWTLWLWAQSWQPPIIMSIAGHGINTSLQKGKKPWQRTCTMTYNFLHGIGSHWVKVVKHSYLYNDLSPRTHGNTGRAPHNALSYTEINNMVKFIQNYVEQHAILLPGRIPGFKRDDLKLLPSSDNKQVTYNT